MPAFVVEMELRIEIVGEIVERQELLNGTQTIALEGSDGNREWALSGTLSWNRGLVDYAGEGDLTLERRDGAELFATLIESRITDAADTQDADHNFDATYVVDGGSVAFENVTGHGEATGTLAGDAFRGIWTLRLELP